MAIPPDKIGGPMPTPTPTAADSGSELPEAFRYERLSQTYKSRAIKIPDMAEKRPSGVRKRSCNRCVGLKVKCSPSQDDDRCQRCARLGRECIFPEKPLYRKPVKSRIDRLQEQVDGLLAQNGMGPTRASSIATSGTPSTVDRETNASLIAGGLVKPDQADTLLGKFRAFKLPQFPFVVVPPTAHAFQFHVEYPFLLLTIMAACSEDNIPLQKSLDHEIKQQISVRVVMNDERNMDLLLGLLVHTAWYQYRYETIHTQMYLCLQLAITLVVDLGIDRTSGLTMSSIAGGPKGSDSESGNYQQSTAKRALLGVFHLSSVLSLFRPQLSMRHSEWIDQCCEDFSQSPEYPTDKLLSMYVGGSVQAIKRSAIINSGQNGIDWTVIGQWQHDINQGYIAPDDMLHIDNWAFYFEVKARPIILLGQMLHQSTAFSADKMSRIADLVQAAEFFIGAFPKIPVDRIVHLPLPFHTYMWYALLVLSKILILSTTGTQETTNLETSVYEKTVAILDRLETLSTGEDLWANSRKIIGGMLSWLKDHMGQKSMDQQESCGDAQQSAWGSQLEDLPAEVYWNADWWQQLVEGSLF